MIDYKNGVCDVCGKHRTCGDHTQCHRQNYDAHKGDKRRKRPGKLSEKEIDNMCKYVGGSK